MYEFLKIRYISGKITKDKLAVFVGKFITEKEFADIVGVEE